MPIQIEKTCSCGKRHTEVPKTARVSHDPGLGGLYWECSCGSTLYVPLRVLKQRALDRCAETCAERWDHTPECVGVFRMFSAPRAAS